MCLADDGVDADGRFAGGAVADDQLALPASDRNHRVDGHDAGLHRLPDGAAADDSGSLLLDSVGRRAGDRAFAVQWLAERVDDAPEQSFADGHLQQLAGGAHLVALPQPCVVAEHDHADLGLVQVQGQSDDPVPEVDHLVQHHVCESLDAGHAVADLANDSDALPTRDDSRLRELRFYFLE